jgi:hypothetical protein
VVGWTDVLHEKGIEILFWKTGLVAEMTRAYRGEFFL